jgi:hypothetical protein
MTGTNCDLFTHKSVPVLFEPPCIKMQQIRNMKCMIIPVTNETTRTAIKALMKNVESTSGKHSADSLQKTAILGSHT